MSSCFTNISIEVPDKSLDLALVHIVPLTSGFDIDPLLQVMSEWDKLGRLGAFCHPQQVPEQVATLVKFAGVQQDGTHLWQVHLNNCDNRCLIVLANVIIDAGYLWLPEKEIIESVYERIRFVPADSNRIGLPRYDYSKAGFAFKDRDYPDVAQIMRPRVILAGTASVRTFRRVVIEFNTSSAEEHFDHISGMVALWGKVIRNGYPRTPEDLYDENSAIDDIAVDLFDEASLEIKVETFGGSESAWHSLINLLGVMRSDINLIKIY